ASDALRRQLDRRQRVLDFVRQAARDLAPGRVALRLQERGDVVEHDDEAAGAAVLARQRGARTHQDAAAGFGLQHELLAPLGLTRVEVRAAGDLELLEQRAALAGVGQRFADDAVDLRAENRAGRLVRGAQRAIRLQRNDAS